MIRLKPHHVILALWVLFLVLPLSFAHAQLDEKQPVDYDQLFKESLKRGGKFLNLSGKKIGDEGLRYLGKQEWLKKVTKIDLRYNEISEDGGDILLQFPTLPKLKSLILRHNFLMDRGTVTLAKARNFPNLVELQLGWSEVRDAGALAFSKTKNFPKLQKLDLRGNFLADETKEELKTTLGHFKSLKLY